MFWGTLFSGGLFLQAEAVFSFEWPLSRIVLAIFLSLLGMVYLLLLCDKNNHTVRLLLPERKRTAVPWNLTDVFIIAICFFTLPVVLYSLVPVPDQIVENLTSVALPKGVDLTKAHPISELMVRAAKSDYAIPVFFLAFLTGVIAAPLTEEFLFRVVFQGALEKEILEKSEGGRKNPNESEIVSCRDLGSDLKKNESGIRISECNISTGRTFDTFYQKFRNFRLNFTIMLTRAFVIVLPAFLFAVIHARNPNETRDIAMLLKGFCVIPAAYFLTLLIGILWLRKVRKAQWTDFGLIQFQKGFFRKFTGDFFRGVIGFILLAPLIFGLLKLLNDLFPARVNDPEVIFILALALGIFYLKTHSWPVIFFLHFCLNLSSFIVVLRSV